MKRIISWALAAGTIALAASSCGGDDDNDAENGGTGGGGVILEGGSDRGGTAGADSSAGNTALAAACATDADCGEGLTCITAASLQFAGQGPAKGFCTADCSNPDDGGSDFCQQFSPDGMCVDYGTPEEPALWCALACSFGPRGSRQFSNEKCHGRRELACSPVFERTTATCQPTGEGCPSGAVCLEGDCYRVLGACAPQCNSDADCGGGLFCDPLTGLCAETAKTGKGTGEPCTTDDECRGSCLTVVDDNDEPLAQLCTESCTREAVPSCGWEGPTYPDVAEAGCIFTASLVGENGGPGAGDRAMCGRLCDCNADCANPDLVCIADAGLRSRYRRAGYCTLPVGEDGGAIRGITACTDAGPRDAGGQ